MGQLQLSPGQSAAPRWERSIIGMHCPEGAKQRAPVLSRECVRPLQGNRRRFCVANPGRRCALPWATMLETVGLKHNQNESRRCILYRSRVDQELLSGNGATRIAQKKPNGGRDRLDGSSRSQRCSAKDLVAIRI